MRRGPDGVQRSLHRRGEQSRELWIVRERVRRQPRVFGRTLRAPVAGAVQPDQPDRGVSERAVVHWRRVRHSYDAVLLRKPHRAVL